MTDFSFLQVRNPKEDETPIESATQIFASVLPYPYIPLLRRLLFVHPKTYAFEIYLINQLVYFYATTPKTSETLVQSLIVSSFPQSKVTKTTDPMDIIFKSKYLGVGEVATNSYSYMPIKTYFDFKDVDPLSALVGFMAKQPPQFRMAVQFVVTPPYYAWQEQGVKAAGSQFYDEAAQKYSMSPLKLSIMKKTTFQAGKVGIRLLVGTDTPGLDPSPHVAQLAGTFGSFSLGEGNQFVYKKAILLKDRLIERIKSRTLSYFERKNQILNSQELASMWHPPGILMAGIKNIAWGKTMSGEPPDNLPIHEESDEEARKDINFFAKTEFKNKDQIFGIKTADRRKHVYIIGKTGAGKSTLIANMAIDDIRRGRGIGIIDPHGDLSEIILDFIPKRRINDVVYLEPFDSERPFKLNVLEVHNPEQKHLVASGIVSIFSKLYGKR